MLLLLVWLVHSRGFSHNGALVVLVEVLPEPACIASAVLLATVSSLMDRPLSLLAEVLPRSALCSFWATVVLPLWFEVCRLVGLRSGERFSPKSPCVCFGRRFSLSVEMSYHHCRLDCLCYSLPGRCRSRRCALGRVSGRCIGQLVSLVVSKFLDCTGGTLCVPVTRMVCFVFLRPTCSPRWWSGGCSGCLAGCASCGSISLALWFSLSCVEETRCVCPLPLLSVGCSG
ncbi:hypothetical protein Taro_030913 [Colocasia esculenta]|uniref:Uncharacterized protein n=1 Tax=Colocasia esculenta TaxID=4460 RepID=A0A843VVA4_COLES|nr:hypothetical protein [Colocasia esculenta]